MNSNVKLIYNNEVIKYKIINYFNNSDHIYY